MPRSLQADVNIISEVVNPLDGCYRYYIRGSILSLSLYILLIATMLGVQK